MISLVKELCIFGSLDGKYFLRVGSVEYDGYINVRAEF
jgi:hypothetical protein